MNPVPGPLEGPGTLAFEGEVAENPRIEDLRRKMAAEPGSRLFAQLAEELRKAGELQEAIQVARDGLSRHPAYGSARMTLGRALHDAGDLEGARTEFGNVLQNAPDNILAGRLLAECLDGLGRPSEALARYRSTLVFAPGDRHLAERIEDIEARIKGTTPRNASTEIGATAGENTVPYAARQATQVARGSDGMVRPATDDAAIPLVSADEGSFEIENPEPVWAAGDRPVRTRGFDAADYETQPSAGKIVPGSDLARSRMHESEEHDQDGRPIPLVSVEESSFELERSYEAPVVGGGVSGADAGKEKPARSGPGFVGEEMTFDLERPYQAAPPETVEPGGAVSTVPLVSGPTGAREFEFESGEPASTLEAEAPETSLGEAAGAESGHELASPTLAELYWSQGLLEKGIEVYRRVLSREPGNQRVRSRLDELEKLARGPRGGPAALAGLSAGADRRRAVQRSIARLQSFLSAMKTRRSE